MGFAGILFGLPLAALPVIVFFAALVAILYHLGIMQRLVRWVGGALGWITGISRVEALGSLSERKLVTRIFTSSTFGDTKELRDTLMATAYPALEELCRALGVEFQVVDMRWGVREST